METVSPPVVGAQDRLARALHTLRMRGTFYSHADMSEPWALRMPTIADSISFHVLTVGSCWLHVEGDDPMELRAGDLALVPHGLGHDLLSSPQAGPPARVDELPQHYLGPNYSVLRHGGGGREARLICGIVTFDEPAARELLHRLPRVVLSRGDSTSVGASIRDTLRLMADELSHPRPGGEAVATRLADILVVQAIRTWLTHDPEARDGWLLALQDDRIGRALDAIHSNPGHEWSLELLARTATMSRSAFSARFTALVGEAPVAYLTRWRMRLAHNRLAAENISAAQVATELGYRSEAAFNRAFVRVVGRTPGAVRRSTETRI